MKLDSHFELKDNNMDFLEALTNEYDSLAYTENGARAYSSTGNILLDLFSKISVSRSFLTNDKKLADKMTKMALESYDKFPLMTLETIIYSRDILNGQGERDVSREFLLTIINDRDDVEMFKKAILAFKEVGRFDDLVYLFVNAKIKMKLNHLFCKLYQIN